MRTLFQIKHALYQQKADSERRAWVSRLKMRPCHDCHIQYSPWVMQFDHRNPKEKSFSIGSNMGIALSKLKNELTKCDVVCANCHSERTWKQRRQGLIGGNKAKS